MRSVALDVHRDFCEVAIAEAGEVRLVGRVRTEPEALELFARSLAASDRCPRFRRLSTRRPCREGRRHKSARRPPRFRCLGRSRRQRRRRSPRQRRGGQRRSDSGRVGLGCAVRRAGRPHQCSAEILPPWVCSALGLLRSSRRSARAGARLAAQTITLELNAIQKKIAITTPNPP
jgi:hypothetical protein